MDDRPSADLTARARIRDTALRLFAERGTEGTTIRDIARLAGVSLGLVRHHFGSKEALRDACDEYVLSRAKRLLAESTGTDGAPTSGFLPAVHPSLVLFNAYFARSMVDGSPAAAAVFAEFVDMTETWLTEHHVDGIDDLRAFAVMVTAMQIGPLAIHQHVSRALGVDMLSPQGHIRITKAVIDIYSRPLLNQDTADAGRAAYQRLERDNHDATA